MELKKKNYLHTSINGNNCLCARAKHRNHNYSSITNKITLNKLTITHRVREQTCRLARCRSGHAAATTGLPPALPGGRGVRGGGTHYCITPSK